MEHSCSGAPHAGSPSPSGKPGDGGGAAPTGVDIVRSPDHPGRKGPELTSVDHFPSRRLPPLTCALLWGAVMTLAGSDASGQTGARSQESRGAAPTVAASTVSTDTSGE